MTCATDRVPASFEERDDYMRAVNAAKGMSKTVKCILHTLALHHNVKSGKCNPAYKTIAAGADVSESTARRCLLQAEATGWLAIRRSSGGHHNATCDFILLMDRARVTGATQMTPLKGGRVSNRPLTGVIAMTPKQREQRRTESL